MSHEQKLAWLPKLSMDPEMMKLMNSAFTTLLERCGMEMLYALLSSSSSDSESTLQIIPTYLTGPFYNLSNLGYRLVQKVALACPPLLAHEHLVQEIAWNDIWLQHRQWYRMVLVLAWGSHLLHRIHKEDPNIDGLCRASHQCFRGKGRQRLEGFWYDRPWAVRWFIFHLQEDQMVTLPRYSPF